MHGTEAFLKRRQLFIFDLDGTLAETSPVHAAAFAAVLEPRGVPVDYATVAGLATGDAVRRLLTRAGQQADDATVAALVAAKRDAASAGLAAVREIAGAGAFVRYASSTHRLALCTSGARATVERTLAVLGFAGCFDPIITADDVTRGKPAPDGFLAVLDRAGIAATDALVFEDSEAGLAAARAAGLDAIRIGQGGVNWADLHAVLARAAA
ncbi:sugar-phosphatase [Novosphingobium sp. CF614]|uniref:HAD family hydrolase n=1 Tax=Novosphingobium sp. CF614 TaxID=1884364 RepID=UPI0008E08C59|nr:HAD family phosphatase [Novosphingobium sp. CF614]SFG20543.1 sugar-phosphatase [Novosphingobium sp. CF614]